MSPKLSEEFKREAEFSEKQSRLNFDAKNDVMANHLAGGASAFRHAATEVAKLEAETEALTKRVAELESELRIAWEDDPAVNELQLEVAVLKDNLGIARKVIDDLKAQLAWTPIAQGLPTEPADYEFTRCVSDIVSEFELVRLTHEGFLLVLSDDTFDRAELLDEVDYTHFRRITLPEAT